MPVDYRPVTWQWSHSMRVNPDALLSAGFTWEFLATFAIANGANHVVEFLNGSDPVGLLGLNLTAQGSRNVLVEYYVGGLITPGTAVNEFPANHNAPQPSPVARITEGATVTTPGTKISETYLGASDRGVSSSSGGAMVLQPVTDYHITFTNNDSQTADLHLEMLLARLVS